MRKVIAIGETVLDIIFRGNQPISAVPGGSTYNSIISLGRSGVPAEFISETGDDRVGRHITSFLEENGVSARSVFIHQGQKSPLSLAFLDEHNDAEYVFYKDHERDELEFEYPEVAADDIILFGSFYAINPIVRQQVKDFLTYAQERGAILYYDVNFRASHQGDIVRIRPNMLENLEMADIVRGSNEDFQILFKIDDADKVYKAEISFYSHNFIYTRGSEPLELRAEGGICRQYPVQKVETVSTIGAGDSFNAGIAYGLIKYGITREDLQLGLSESQWDSIIGCAQHFSSCVCQSLYNYVSEEFGQQMKQELEQSIIKEEK